MLSRPVSQAGRRHHPLGAAVNFPELFLQGSSKTTAMISLFVDGLDEVLVAQAFFGRNELAHCPRAVSWTGMFIERKTKELDSLHGLKVAALGENRHLSLSLYRNLLRHVVPFLQLRLYGMMGRAINRNFASAESSRGESEA